MHPLHPCAAITTPPRRACRGWAGGGTMAVVAWKSGICALL